MSCVQPPWDRDQYAGRVARDLLAHVPLIALSIGPDLCVGPGGTSDLARQILGAGEPLEGRPFAELFLPGEADARDREVLDAWLGLIFEQPYHDWSTVIDLCPLDEVRLPGAVGTGTEREYRLTYHPLRAGEGGPVVRVLVVGLDVTAERALARELENRDEEGEKSVRRFAEILKLGAETFRRFINESYLRLAEATVAADRLTVAPDDAEAVKAAFRHVHTLTANARAFRLDWIVEAAEQVSSALAAMRESPVPGEAEAFPLLLERLESLRVTYDEADQIAAGIFGYSLDPGETRGNVRDLEIGVRVGRLESARALASGARALVVREDADLDGAGDLMARAAAALDSLMNVPAGLLFRRFPKMVADLAAVAGKRVEPLRVSGSDTLISIRVLDRVGDAMVHLLRNAVAHGIEPPGTRTAQGKPEAGVVELSVAAEDDGLVFEVRDDGAGVDRQAVKAAAVSKGLVTAEEAGALPDEEIQRLLFCQGLTTAAGQSGTRLGAGLGVGLDTARATADYLGGTIAIESEPGRGTRVRLVVPRGLSG